MNRRAITPSFVAIFLMFFVTRGVTHEPQAQGCGAASPDVALELAVMRSPAVPVTAVSGKDSLLPALTLDKHYAINLIAQNEVAFRARPGRAARNESPRGGLLSFEVPAAGRYRISITSRHWIDVIDGKSILSSAAHHGPACELLHKIVEFDLPTARPLTLQLSGRDDAIIGLAITVSPSAPKQGST